MWLHLLQTPTPVLSQKQNISNEGMINAMVAKTMAQSFEKRRTRHLQRLNRDSWHQDPAPSVGLRSEGRISSTRRIFVEFSSDRTYIYIIRSSSNFFREIRRIFDEFHVTSEFLYSHLIGNISDFLVIF